VSGYETKRLVIFMYTKTNLDVVVLAAVPGLVDDEDYDTAAL